MRALRAEFSNKPATGYANQVTAQEQPGRLGSRSSAPGQGGLVVAALKVDGLRGGRREKQVLTHGAAAGCGGAAPGAPPLRDAVHRGCVTQALTLAKTVL